jgi:hypothetical protein
VLAALASEKTGPTTLTTRAKEALTAGKQMPDAANLTLKTFQDVLAQLDANPSDPKSEAFRIPDHTAAAAEIRGTAQRLVEFLQAFDLTIGPEDIEALSSRVGLLAAQRL